MVNHLQIHGKQLLSRVDCDVSFKSDVAQESSIKVSLKAYGGKAEVPLQIIAVTMAHTLRRLGSLLRSPDSSFYLFYLSLRSINEFITNPVKMVYINVSLK